MELFIKNLAHFSHGMLLCFFLVVSFDLWQQREKNRLLRFLQAELLFWVFIELKDLIYLYEPWWHDTYISTINLTVDMWTIPATMLLMFEVLSPGWVCRRRMVGLMTPFVLFTLVFVLTQSRTVFYVLAAYALLSGTFSILLVWRASKRYDRFIRSNFSYVENLEVRWIRVFITMLYGVLIGWMATNLVTTWLGDVVFYLSSLVLWGLIYYNTRRHHVIEVPDLLLNQQPAEAEAETETEAEVKAETEVETLSADAGEEDMPQGDVSRVAVRQSETAGTSDEAPAFDFSERLTSCMEERKLYLNPRLSVAEVAAEVGTNRTYLSHFINSTLNTSFYEYVNTFRVHEASSVLVQQSDLPLADVAVACGFNSLSTFRRSFGKLMGCTPAEYRAEKLKLPPPVLTKNSIWRIDD